MSETANVRLVRCPKCENLLPEVTDYSAYQCGGCGAVLRAENQYVDLDKLSYKSDEERIVGTLEKLSDKSEKLNAFEKRMMDMNDCSESDVRSTISSSSRGERRRILRDGAENHMTNMLNKEEKWDVKADAIQDTRSDELHQAKIAQNFEHLAIDNENEEIGLRSSGRVVDGRNVDRSEMEGFRSAQRMESEGVRYSKEGQSNFLSRSSYDYENPMRNRNDMNGFNNDDYAGEERAELLKMLDELKYQLSRSGNKNDKGKEKVSLDRRMTYQESYVSENQYPVAPLGMNRALEQYSYPDTQFKRPPYQNQYVEPPPLMHRQELDGNGIVPPRYPPSHVQGYGDPLRSQMLRRGPHQNPAPFQHQTSHAYMPGHFINDGMVYMDSMEPYPFNVSRHHPSCSCFQCRNKREVPPSVQPTAYGDKFSDVPNDTMFNYHNNRGSFGPREFNRRVSDNPSLRSHSDVNSEVDDFICRRPPRVHLGSGGKSCRPIAGGAPFFTCYNCFELLMLPKKILTQNNGRKKMRCGACSTLVVFAFSEKNLVVLIDVEVNDTPVKVYEKPDLLSARGDGRLNQSRTTFSSDDYDNSGFDFQSMDREVGQLSTGQRTDNKSMDLKSRHRTSAYTSEAEEDRESLTAARKDSSLADLPTKDTGPPPQAGSPLGDRIGYLNNYHGVDRFEEGNRSGRGERDKVFANKASTGKISMKDSSSATEIDILSNEYSNTGTTFDSGEGSREGDRLKGSRAGSFFARIKIFRDSSRSNQTVEPEIANVTINGHLIADRLIKKAEKLAGPIHPGHYWYDFRAGFWGAMGGPCLGIIPPFIPEFNYPIPENCAGGNTSVFVNGRELGQKDLNLLGSRGLPTERDRSYIIELSGRLLDEDTGEELEGLGKLAPTVEKAKRGFGMRDPKAAALPPAY